MRRASSKLYRSILLNYANIGLTLIVLTTLYASAHVYLNHQYFSHMKVQATCPPDEHKPKYPLFDEYGYPCTSGCGVVTTGGAQPAIGSGWTDPRTGIDYKVYGHNPDGSLDVGPDTSVPFEGGGIERDRPDSRHPLCDCHDSYLDGIGKG